MKVTKIKAGEYVFVYESIYYDLIKCDLLKEWTIYGFGNKMIAGGLTKKEALEIFQAKMTRNRV